jgi:hypothetical protein
MTDEQRAKFKSIAILLEEAGEGIGKGDKLLQKASTTEIGTLVVKDGTITIDFELTSEATDRSISAGPVFGAKTVSFSAAASEVNSKDSSRAKVQLNLVRIPSEKPADAPVTVDKKQLETALRALRNRSSEQQES